MWVTFTKVTPGVMANHSKTKQKEKRKSSSARYIINPLEGNVVQHDDCFTFRPRKRFTAGLMAQWKSWHWENNKSRQRYQSLGGYGRALSVLHIDLFRCHCLFWQETVFERVWQVSRCWTNRVNIKLKVVVAVALSLQCVVCHRVHCWSLTHWAFKLHLENKREPKRTSPRFRPQHLYTLCHCIYGNYCV